VSGCHKLSFWYARSFLKNWQSIRYSKNIMFLQSQNAHYHSHEQPCNGIYHETVAPTAKLRTIFSYRPFQYCGIYAQSNNCGARETAVASGRLWKNHSFIGNGLVTRSRDNRYECNNRSTVGNGAFYSDSQKSYKEDNWGNRVSYVRESVKKGSSWKGVTVQRGLARVKLKNLRYWKPFPGNGWWRHSRLEKT
jgi:hypothetical protein